MALLEVVNKRKDQISAEQYRRLAEFQTSSWAVWSPGFNSSGCEEDSKDGTRNYIWNNRKSELKNNIVLMGFNRSGKAGKEQESEPERRIFGNFHTPRHKGDKLLKEAIQTENLINITGGYMSDLSQTINSNMEEVLTDFDPRKAKEAFEAQLDILDSKSFKVICWGLECFNKIVEEIYPSDIKPIEKKNMGDSKFLFKKYVCKHEKYLLTFYFSLHYSYIVNGRGNHRRPEFIENLKFINDDIGLVR